MREKVSDLFVNGHPIPVRVDNPLTEQLRAESTMDYYATQNGEDVHTTGQAPWHRVGGCSRCKKEQSLQLLIIDLGDSCVVKAEKGYFDLEPFILPGDETRNLTDQNYPYLLRKPFPELRTAIDALADGEKPVPRIEQDDPGGGWHFYWQDDKKPTYIGPIALAALQRLTDGHVQIWTPKPKRGEWKKLLPVYLNDMYQGGDITNASWIDGGSGVEIWRYTK